MLSLGANPSFLKATTGKRWEMEWKLPTYPASGAGAGVSWNVEEC